MAVDMFLKIKGVDGEATDDKHKNEIDVLSWSWGMSQSGTFHTGGGGGAGKVNVQDITVVKYVDKSSPVLMGGCTTGEHYPEALLTVRKAGKTPLEYIKIKMTKVMVTSVSTGGSGGEDRLTENLSLNFSKVEFIYQQQSATGGKEGGEIKYSYDISLNKLA